jgi:hypothetical protein
MTLALFAGLRVHDFAVARGWYERLLGEPSFFPHATEAVWRSPTSARCTSRRTPTTPATAS